MSKGKIEKKEVKGVIEGEVVADILEYIAKKVSKGSKRPEDLMMLPLVVSELSVMMYRKWNKNIVNIDEVIESMRWQAEERAKYLFMDFESVGHDNW